MKITINNKSQQTLFSTIEVGDIFQFSNDLFLKIEHCNDRGEEGWCVCLTDYSTCTLTKNDKVIPVDAELFIYPKGL